MGPVRGSDYTPRVGAAVSWVLAEIAYVDADDTRRRIPLDRGRNRVRARSAEVIAAMSGRCLAMSSGLSAPPEAALGRLALTYRSRSAVYRATQSVAGGTQIFRFEDEAGAYSDTALVDASVIRIEPGGPSALTYALIWGGWIPPSRGARAPPRSDSVVALKAELGRAERLEEVKKTLAAAEAERAELRPRLEQARARGAELTVLEAALAAEPVTDDLPAHIEEKIQALPIQEKRFQADLSQLSADQAKHERAGEGPDGVRAYVDGSGAAFLSAVAMSVVAWGLSGGAWVAIAAHAVAVAMLVGHGVRRSFAVERRQAARAAAAAVSEERARRVRRHELETSVAKKLMHARGVQDAEAFARARKERARLAARIAELEQDMAEQRRALQKVEGSLHEVEARCVRLTGELSALSADPPRSLPRLRSEIRRLEGAAGGEALWPELESSDLELEFEDEARSTAGAALPWVPAHLGATAPLWRRCLEEVVAELLPPASIESLCHRLGAYLSAWGGEDAVKVRVAGGRVGVAGPWGEETWRPLDEVLAELAGTPAVSVRWVSALRFCLVELLSATRRLPVWVARDFFLHDAEAPLPLEETLDFLATRTQVIELECRDGASETEGVAWRVPLLAAAT